MHHKGSVNEQRDFVNGACSLVGTSELRVTQAVDWLSRGN